MSDAADRLVDQGYGRAGGAPSPVHAGAGPPFCVPDPVDGDDEEQVAEWNELELKKLREDVSRPFLCSEWSTHLFVEVEADYTGFLYETGVTYERLLPIYCGCCASCFALKEKAGSKGLLVATLKEPSGPVLK